MLGLIQELKFQLSILSSKVFQTPRGKKKKTCYLNIFVHNQITGSKIAHIQTDGA